MTCNVEKIIPYAKEIFDSCRKGNLENLRIIVQENDVELNIRDKWDSSPLYYACLCGHNKTVEYLLQNGAKCQANTFDGERCLYSALNQKTKAILKDYKAITKDCIRRDNYVEFFNQRLTSQAFKDFYFVVHGSHIFVHKVVLASRSSYFAEMFQTKWKNKHFIHLKHHLVTIPAFHLMIQYLYTARIDINLHEVEDLKRLCKQCCLVELEEKLDTAIKNFQFYANSKPKYLREKVSIFSIQPEYNSTVLNESYTSLAEACIPKHLQYNNTLDIDESLPDIFYIELPDVEEDILDDEPKSITNMDLSFVDICFCVNGVEFYGHKVFYCGRSEYFQSLVHFSEISSPVQSMRDDILVLHLNEISAEVFSIILTFLYTNNALIPDDLIHEVLYFAALYLLPTLKKICCSRLEKLICEENVLEIIQLARLYKMAILEAECCAFIANHIDELVTQRAFAELIRKDADEIIKRHATDSIQIVDDIRFHIHKSELPGMQNDQDMLGSPAEQKLEILDSLLQELDLEC